MDQILYALMNLVVTHVTEKIDSGRVTVAHVKTSIKIFPKSVVKTHYVKILKVVTPVIVSMVTMVTEMNATMKMNVN